MICGEYICKRTFYEHGKQWAGAHNTHPKAKMPFGAIRISYLIKNYGLNLSIFQALSSCKV
jgi:hypothetical protein